MSFPDPSGPAFRQALTRVFPRNPNTHWLNIAAMLADAAFETDPFGRFTAFGQSSVLGHATELLIGQNIAEFCKLASNTSSASNSFGSIFATLDRQNLIWRGVAAITRGDGSQGYYQLLLAPKPSEGRSRKAPMAGAYGLLIDMDAPELQIQAPASGRAVGMLDAETGLWSAATFAEEAGRRFDRLDVEGLPGTLLLLGFGRTPAIGHNAIAARLAQELRDVSRPTDILGRVDATTFGLWCDGMDDLTGAERAARFCQRLPAALPGNPCICVGLVARWPGNPEDVGTLIKHARKALQQADKAADKAMEAGGSGPVASGAWRAWNPPRS